MSNPNKTRLNEALQQLSYGFYVVATRADGEELATRSEDWVSAGTVSWAMQTSFQPPLITIAIQKDSDLNETIQKSQVFSLTILGKDERDLIERFANNSDVDYSGNTVNGISYKEGTTGAPILDCGVATLDCRLHDALTTDGDHLLFVGYVEDVIVNDGEPITERDTRFEYAGTSARS
ncbi:flavin reductase family protein [Neolewinella agarilytica]|uniref:flavin reductase family protein n=1 Tax=Neolewinella agarilytica TaxID=478744 RepID=UPI00235789FB|nr:flavin reductase family protein [Neolewinella agarilytica]